VSSAAFAQESLSSVSLKAGLSTLRVNPPGDSHEVEADHVAECVSRGERIASWSLNTVSTRAVQRDPDSAPGGPASAPAKKPSTSDMAAKAAEVLLATKAGQAAVAAIKRDPVVKSTAEFFSTPAGIVIAGTAATAVVTGLAIEHKPLPFQLPKIPLDFVHPGLSMNLSYQGPVDRPTAASITLSFTPKSTGQEKNADPNASIRDEINQLRAQQEWIRGSMSDAVRPGPLAHPAANSPKAVDAAAGKAQPPRTDGAHAVQQPLPKPADATAQNHDKREETVVQRKAEPLAEMQPASAGGVREALNDPGRPIDQGTRGYMESHFGVDFGNVRVHTDDRAAQSARNINARAYTVGADIVFSPGTYAPETVSGRKLLAHELTHVVQQSPGAGRKAAGLSASPRRVQRSLGSWASGLLDKVRSIPGYDLFCTIIGKDVVTWENKPSTKEDILREAVKLVGGEDAYERLTKAAGAIERAWEWFNNELVNRHLTLDDFKSLIDQAKNSLSLEDLAHIGEAVERIKGIFRPAYESALDLAKVAFHKFFELVVEVIMDNFGETGKQVIGFLKKAGDTIVTIAKDPIKFVGYLIDALKLGFKDFAGNFLTHLKDSLMEFLFGEVGSRIKPPKEFSLSAIFGLVLDVLDLNYAAFRERLVAKTSPDAVTVLEDSVDTIGKMAQAKSLSAAWNIFKEQAGNLIDELVQTALDKIKSWVLTKVVQKAMEKVVELFTPASAVIAAIEAIYHAIVTLIEKGKQLIAVLKATVDSIARIAAGDITQAADKIEIAMSKALNFIVAFLAEQGGVGDIGKTIREIIRAVKDKVWSVVDKVIDYVLGKAKGLLQRAQATAGKVLAWWQQRKEMQIGGEDHAVYMEGSGESPHLMVASSPTSWADYVADLEPKAKGARKKLLDDTKALVAKLEKPLDKSKSTSENSEQVENKREIFKKVCDNIVTLGFKKAPLPMSSAPVFGPVTQEGVGTSAKAEVLSSLHSPGSAPSEDSKLWTTMQPLIEKKSYVRGHLLNDQLGGPGLNPNLTPINKRCNSRHHSIVEKEIKDKTFKERKVIFYEVKAIYEGHPKKPRPMIKLEEQNAKQELTGKSKALLEAYQAEQKTASGLEFNWYELQRTPEDKWEKVDSTGNSGGIPNQLDLTT
jgi:hypothetical protein